MPTRREEMADDVYVRPVPALHISFLCLRVFYCHLRQERRHGKQYWYYTCFCWVAGAQHELASVSLEGCTATSRSCTPDFAHSCVIQPLRDNVRADGEGHGTRALYRPASGSNGEPLAVRVWTRSHRGERGEVEGAGRGITLDCSPFGGD
jgi:hypothetical protein